MQVRNQKPSRSLSQGSHELSVPFTEQIAIFILFYSLLCLLWALNLTISTEFPYLGVVVGVDSIGKYLLVRKTPNVKRTVSKMDTLVSL